MTTSSRPYNGKDDGSQDVVRGMKDILDGTDGVPVVDDRLQHFFDANDDLAAGASGRKVFAADKAPSAADLPPMEAREVGARDALGALPLPEAPKPFSLGTSLFEPIQKPLSDPASEPDDQLPSDTITPPAAPEPLRPEEAEAVSFEAVSSHWTEAPDDAFGSSEQSETLAPLENPTGFLDDKIPVEAPPSAFDEQFTNDGANTINLNARAVPLALQARVENEASEAGNLDAGKSFFDAGESSVDDGQTISVDGWTNGLPSIPGLDDRGYDEPIPDVPAGYGEPEFEPRLASLGAAIATAAPLTGVYSDIEHLRGPDEQAVFGDRAPASLAHPVYHEEESKRAPLVLGLLALAALLVGGGLAWAWQLSRSDGNETASALTEAEVPAGPSAGNDLDGSTAQGAGAGGDDDGDGGGVNGGELGASFGGLEQDDDDDTTSSTSEVADEGSASPSITLPSNSLQTTTTARRTTTTARRTTTTATTTTQQSTTTPQQSTTTITQRSTTTTTQRSATTTTQRSTTTSTTQRPTIPTTPPTTQRPTTTSTTQRPTIPTTPPTTQRPTTTSTTPPTSPTTTAPEPITIGDKVYVNSFSGPGAAGVTVGLWRDIDGDEVGDTVVSVTTTNGEGRYSFTTQPGCYSVLFRASGDSGEIDPDFEGRSVCLDAGESDFTLDSILLVAAPEPPTQCVVEPTFGDAVRIVESDQRWADDYVLYSSSGSVLGRTSAIGDPIVVSSTERRWVTPFNHRDVASVAAVISDATSDRVACRS